MLVWNLTRRTAIELATAKGCMDVAVPADLTKRCNNVVTMLADDAASETVHFCKDGLLAAAGAMTVVHIPQVTQLIRREALWPAWSAER